MNKKLKIIGCITIISICAFLGIYNGLKTTDLSTEMYNGLPVNYAHSLWMYDSSTPERAVGISDYVFVAKINKILRTEYTNQMEIEVGLNETETFSNPYTIYEIEVIENIKGNLIIGEPIEFKQYGGLNSDGVSYTFLEGGSLLNVGEYYIILCNTFGSDREIEVADPDRIVSFGSHYNPYTRSNNVISVYRNAFINQIVPEDLNEFDNNISKYDVNYVSE